MPSVSRCRAGPDPQVDPQPRSAARGSAQRQARPEGALAQADPQGSLACAFPRLATRGIRRLRDRITLLVEGGDSTNQPLLLGRHGRCVRRRARATVVRPVRGPSRRRGAPPAHWRRTVLPFVCEDWRGHGIGPQLACTSYRVCSSYCATCFPPFRLRQPGIAGAPIAVRHASSVSQDRSDVRQQHFFLTRSRTYILPITISRDMCNCDA